MPKLDNFFSSREIRFLKELVKNKVEFIVVGLSAAALHGAPVVTQDIDLWIKDLSAKEFHKAIKRVGGVYVPPIGLNPPRLAGDDMQLFDLVLNLDGLDDFADEYKNASEIKIGSVGVKVLSLDRIIKSKKAANRKKDKLSLPVLEDALKVLRVVK